MFLPPAHRLIPGKVLRTLYRTPTRSATTRTTPPSPYQSPPKVDTSAHPKPKPSYKQLERRWVGIMVGLPVAIVSGWTLYKREVLGEVPKKLVKSEEDAEEDGGKGGVVDPETGKKATIF